MGYPLGFHKNRLKVKRCGRRGPFLFLYVNHLGTLLSFKYNRCKRILTFTSEVLLSHTFLKDGHNNSKDKIVRKKIRNLSDCENFLEALKNIITILSLIKSIIIKITFRFYDKLNIIKT